jgi:purine nucleosidase
MMCIVCPDFVTNSIQCYGNCITDPGEAYGLVLFYRDGFSYDLISTGDYDYDVTLICDVNGEENFSGYLERISRLE